MQQQGLPPTHQGRSAEQLQIFSLPLTDGVHFSQLRAAEEGVKSRLSIYEKTIRTLPVPPALWHSFQRACQQGASTQKLGSIIKDDPVLSAAILRIANAPGLGVRVEVTDVGRAVTHLGTSLVRTIVSRHAFSAGLKDTAKPFHIKTLWKHGMTVSALAEIIADFIPGCDANEASTLGLFHDIGKMALNLFPEYMLPATQGEQGHLIFEHQRFACTHIDAGILLAKHWQLPEKIIDGIQYHHHPAFAAIDDIPESIRREVFAVYLADMMAIYFGFGAGESSMVIPDTSFTQLLQGTTLQELIEYPKVKNEIARIEQVEF